MSESQEPSKQETLLDGNMEARALELAGRLGQIEERLTAVSFGLSIIGAAMGNMNNEAGERMIEDLLDAATSAEAKGFDAMAREFNSIATDMNQSRLGI